MREFPYPPGFCRKYSFYVPPFRRLVTHNGIVLLGLFYWFYQRYFALRTSSIFKTNSIGILAPYQRCIGSQKETNFILYFFFSILWR